MNSHVFVSFSHLTPKVKIASARAIDRTATACLADSSCLGPDDHAAFYNFSRQAIKNGEHTWGLHVQSYGPYQTVGYRNTDFHAELQRGKK